MERNLRAATIALLAVAVIAIGVHSVSSVNGHRGKGDPASISFAAQPRAGQTLVRGRLRALRGHGRPRRPFALPFTIEVPTRGGGGADMTPASVTFGPGAFSVDLAPQPDGTYLIDAVLEGVR